MTGNARAEPTGLSICRTCLHAEDAGHLTRDADLYICRELVPPLREYAASTTPEYVLVNEEGPAHARLFSVAVRFQGEELGAGKASSKKEAEQLAARTALDVLRERTI